MKRTIKKSLQALLLVPVLALGMSAVIPVSQPTAFAQAPSGGVRAGSDAAATDEIEQEAGLFDPDGMFEQITGLLLFIIGAVAVVMLIYGGFKYVTSSGDSSAVTSAKNTILYAIIGIIVALLSWAILDFVLKALGT